MNRLCLSRRKPVRRRIRSRSVCRGLLLLLLMLLFFYMCSLHWETIEEIPTSIVNHSLHLSTLASSLGAKLHIRLDQLFSKGSEYYKAFCMSAAVLVNRKVPLLYSQNPVIAGCLLSVLFILLLAVFLFIIYSVCKLFLMISDRPRRQELRVSPSPRRVSSVESTESPFVELHKLCRSRSSQLQFNAFLGVYLKSGVFGCLLSRSLCSQGVAPSKSSM